MIDQVSRLIREVAEEAILPRFRRLAKADVRSKSPGEEVTAADEEAEELLSRRLPDLLPGSRAVGEEAVARQPGLLDDLGQGTAWLIDPVDGTSNFIAGSTCFSVMVALLRDGEVVASWLLSPARGTLHVAERGSGATVDGVRVRTAAAPDWSDLRGSVLTRFLPHDIATRITRRAASCRAVLPGLRCAGEEYPAIAAGRQNFAVFWRALPWDHAPGVLFLEEAGGRATRFDGAPYLPAEQGHGILAAQTPELWAELRGRLLDPE